MLSYGWSAAAFAEDIESTKVVVPAPMHSHRRPFEPQKARVRRRIRKAALVCGVLVVSVLMIVLIRGAGAGLSLWFMSEVSR
jgi:hypothetical protein